MKSYWAQLVGAAEKISLYAKPGVEYNVMNLENFVFTQAGGAIYTLLEILGEERFREGLKHRGTQLNPKYKALLEQYSRK